MAKIDYAKLANEVITLLGGSSNVVSAGNCMTRLRVTVNNSTLIKMDELKKLQGVMQVFLDGTIIQVVLGPGVAQKVASEVNALTKSNTTKMSISSDWKQNKDIMKEKRNKFGWLTKGMRHLANIFTPLIPAIIAAGLFAALAAIVNQFGANGAFTLTPLEGIITKDEINEILSKVNSSVKAFYYLFTAFSGGFTAYLVLACGYNAAKEFGATPMLGLMLGGICIASEITKLAFTIGIGGLSEGDLNAPLRAGKGGVIGIIIAVLLLSYVEKFLHKKMPNAVDTVLTPFLSILIVGTIYVFGIMIVTGYISYGISWIIGQLVLSEHIIVRMIIGFVSAALFLPLVMMGMHHGLVAFYSIEIVEHGFISLYPALAMAGAGQVGAAIALYIKAKRVKNEQLQKNITGSIVPGICGVGEPLIYSVTLPLGIPFVTAGLGAGIGGAFLMAFQVASTAYGPSGIIATPLMVYVAGQPNALLGYGLYFIGLLISAAGGFLFTWFMVKNKRLEPTSQEAKTTN